jgi:hypothetical protein
MIDQVENEVRVLFAEQAATVPVASVTKVVSVDYHPRGRRLMPMMAGAVTLAAAGVCALTVLAASGSGNVKSNAAPGERGGATRHTDAARNGTANTVRLAGYVVHFPAGYPHVGTAANCTDELVSRVHDPLVATPDGGCPLVIQSVISALPATATAESLKDGSTPVRFYSSTSPSTGTTGYFPARLPDGRHVYVSLGYGHAKINVQQAIQLANGLNVTPTGSCTDPNGCG